MSVAITPLSDALGVAVTGVDLAQPVLPSDLKAMKQALRHQSARPMGYVDWVR